MIRGMLYYFIHELPAIIPTGIFLVLFFCKKDRRPAFSRPEVIACVLLLLNSLVIGVIQRWLILFEFRQSTVSIFLSWGLDALNILVALAGWILLIVAFGLLSREREPASSQSATEAAADTFKA
ncbi:MAG: hypothetical protein VB877_08510 [Pirellulaceae bacterium]